MYIAWAEANRSAAVRIPLYKPGKEVATRVELRFPDPTCNPYLAFSVMLAAGLDGLENETECPDPMTIDLYKLTAMEREEMNIKALPHDLFEAARVGERSDFLRAAIGEEVHEKLIEAKIMEADQYRLYVSAKELEDHLVL